MEKESRKAKERGEKREGMEKQKQYLQGGTAPSGNSLVCIGYMYNDEDACDIGYGPFEGMIGVACFLS